MTLRKLLSLPLLLVLLAAGGIGVAHAQDPIAWAIATVDGEHGQGRPNFGYEAAPGTVITDAINVTNTGIEDLELAVYAADGFTTSSGTLDLLPAGEPSTGVGVWTVPSVMSLALEPGESIDVPFTITVPSDATPGDHTGGIITSWSTGGSGTVESEHRSAMRIHISVPGERVAELSVGDVVVEAGAAWVPFAPVALDVTYQLTNSGNSRALGHEVVSAGGPGSPTAATTTSEILPGSTVERVVEVAGVWPLFRVDVTVEVTPELLDGSRGEPVVVTRTVTVVPWGAIVALLVVVGVGVGVAVWRHRSNYEWIEVPDDAAAKPDEAPQAAKETTAEE